MHEEALRKKISSIRPADRQAESAARKRWDSLAKPIDGMGLFEDMVVTLAGVQGSPEVDISRRAILIMCGDHGVVAEGVSQTDPSVTGAVANAVACGTSTINILASAAGADCFAVDTGMVCDKSTLSDRVWDLRVKNGTGNIAEGPAMTREEACQAVLAGIEAAGRISDMGHRILVCGEMGIGNTTPTAAITALLTGLSPEELTGRGAGLSDDGLERKKKAIKRALEINDPDPEDPLDLLSKIGGLEIAGMTGVYLGAAIYRIPVIIDVSVSTAAALLAARLCPYAADYMIASNQGKEKTAAHLNRLLGVKPVMCAEMALGEASGGVMILPLLDMALELYRKGRTFDGAGLEAYERFDSSLSEKKKGGE